MARGVIVIKPLTILFLAFMLGASWMPATAQQSSLDGVWEGVWYRGMTSGTLRLELTEGSGRIQFVGLDSFGAAAQPLREASLTDGTFSLQTAGTAGTPLKATFPVKPSAREMKGFGSYEGFTLRFELRRVAP
jgi:hypothetical protein